MTLPVARTASYSFCILKAWADKLRQCNSNSHQQAPHTEATIYKHRVPVYFSFKRFAPNTFITTFATANRHGQLLLNSPRTGR